MWLVGYVYNHNGMGAWCLEAAHALAESGERVALVCAPGLELPGGLPFEVMRVESIRYAPSIAGRLSEELHRLSTSGPRVMRVAAARAAARGDAVRFILLNSSEFFDPELAAPQLVTAWARGVGLAAYLARLRTHLRGVSLHSARMTLDAVGWWRRDWFAFRRAALVLAVSTPLTTELRDAGVRAQLLHPCIDVPDEGRPSASHAETTRLLIVAESLDLPRKRVRWMLEALRGWDSSTVSLTMVGDASEAMRELARETGLVVTVTGRVPRAAVQEHMQRADVFLFGSVLDDWGYVLAEAMSRGMAVVAPRASPFDEIVGDAGVLFDPDSASAFRSAVERAAGDAGVLGTRAATRAREHFSREAFVRRLRELVAAHVVQADGAQPGRPARR